MTKCHIIKSWGKYYKHEKGKREIKTKGKFVMIFKDKKHEKMYKDLCNRMCYVDCFHAPVAYLIAMDNVLREHVDEVFDFDKDIILVDVLKEPWQTGTSRTTRARCWC